MQSFEYELKVTWNGTPVLHAQGTASMLYDILRGFGENYVNPDKAGFTMPTLRMLRNFGLGEAFECVNIDDETSTASYRIERIMVR